MPAVESSRWEERFAVLEQYVAREKHSRVPQLHNEDGVLLGRWVNRQREHYAASMLDDERIERLEALPAWTWNAFDAAWDARFAALADFAEREGSTSVPRDHIEAGLRLTGWVARQREAYRANRLPAERVERLESLPGWSWGRTRRSAPAVRTRTA